MGNSAFGAIFDIFFHSLLKTKNKSLDISMNIRGISGQDKTEYTNKSEKNGEEGQINIKNFQDFFTHVYLKILFNFRSKAQLGSDATIVKVSFTREPI